MCNLRYNSSIVRSPQGTHGADNYSACRIEKLHRQKEHYYSLPCRLKYLFLYPLKDLLAVSQTTMNPTNININPDLPTVYYIIRLAAITTRLESQSVIKNKKPKVLESKKSFEIETHRHDDYSTDFIQRFRNVISTNPT